MPLVHADASMHLPKRFSHWVVDTLRAVSWIGPAPIAWAEDEALRAARRLPPGHVPARAATRPTSSPPPSRLRLRSTRRRPRSRRPTGPRRASRPSGSPPRPGEGEWVVPDVPWLRRVPGVTRRRSVALLPDVRPPRRGASVCQGAARGHGHAAARPPDGGRRRGPRAAHRSPWQRPHPARARRLPARRGRLQRRLQDRARALRDDGAQAGAPAAASGGRPRSSSSTTGASASARGAPTRRSAASSASPTTRSTRSGRTSTRSSTTARSNPTGRNLWGFTPPGQGRADRAHGALRDDERPPSLRLGRRRQRHDARQGHEDGRVRLRDAPRHEPVPHGVSLPGHRRSRRPRSTARSS